MKPLAQKVAQCEGLIGTKDVTPWENEFLQSVVSKCRVVGTTTFDARHLTSKQVDVLDRIHSKHFA